MIKRGLLVIGFLTLLMVVMFALKLQSRSELTDAEVKALPKDLSVAAIQQRNTRLQMGGSSWVFAMSGSSEAVTDGDVEKAKMELALTKPKTEVASSEYHKMNTGEGESGAPGGVPPGPGDVPKFPQPGSK